MFDKNLDGFVSWYELERTFKELGMKKSWKEMCAIMMESDVNGDGIIDYLGGWVGLVGELGGWVGGMVGWVVGWLGW